MTTLVSVTERDHLDVAVDDPLAAFSGALTEAGLTIEACRQATTSDVKALDSSWAKRLGIPKRRPAWLLVARQP